MNGTPPRIEIFKPFGEAFEWMKRMLFQPFDLAKWCVVGFAAFLAGSFGGGGFSGRFPNGKHSTWAPSGSHDIHHAPWVAALIVVAVLVGLAIVIVLLWIRARGKFIFTDCIVHNRAAIKQPWREYRREGNSYFLFLLGLFFVSMLIVGTVVGTFVVLIWIVHVPDQQKTILFVSLGVLAFLAWILYAVTVGLVSYFMPAVMYVRRCRALEAFEDLLRLVRAHVGPFVLFALFSCVLFLAAMVVGLIVACATCCAAAIPYVGTVILLPAIVWIRSFGLFFLKQFGPEYDVWGARLPVTELPPAPPPLPA